MYMKPSSRQAARRAAPGSKKKINYQQAACAIRRKLEEIKQENKMPAALNNNLSLFRYRV